MTMTRAEPECEAGDFVLVTLDPVRGTEQAGTRPALVISSSGMHAFSRRTIVCPITRNLRPWPTKVMIGEHGPVQGAVLVDQVRAVDRNERILRKLGSAPQDLLEKVHETLGALLGIPLATRES